MLHLESAIDNMSRGFLMFDSSARLVIVNQRYLDMHGLSADAVRPRRTIRELLRLRKEAGSLAGDVDAYCANLAPARRGQGDEPDPEDAAGPIGPTSSTSRWRAVAGW